MRRTGSQEKGLRAMGIRGWERERIAVVGMVAMLLGCELIGTGSLCDAQSACDWATGFAEFDFNGPVSTMVAFDDGSGVALYAGGNFSIAGEEVVNHVARWDGTGWRALSGSSGTGTDGAVTAMAVFDDGGGPALFVAGYFDSAGGLSVNNIARWDGSEWSPLAGSSGVGTSLGVRALAVYDDGDGTDLYVGGQFFVAGGLTVSRIARWDGAEWSALTGSSGTGTSAYVSALAVHDDGTGSSLFVGGSFDSAGGIAASGIAKWDGSEWLAFGGVSGGYTSVDALTVYDDGGGPELYVGGNFISAGGVTANSIARWDGTVWSGLTGSTGTGVGNTLDVSVYTLSVFDSELFVGGTFSTAGGLAVSRIARWDGGEWYELAGPAGTGTDDGVYSLQSFELRGEEQLVAAGSFRSAGGVYVNRIAVWNNSAWSALAGAAVAHGLDAGVAAIGAFDDGGGMALVVGGGFTSASGSKVNHVARWDGLAWDALSGPADVGTSAEARAFAVFDDGSGPALFVGGDFATAGGVVVNNVAKWDGSQFLALSGASGTGVDGPVHDLSVHDDGDGVALFVGGDFSSAGSWTANNVAKWDGLEWSALVGPAGNGTSHAVAALAVYDDGSGDALYAGGSFLTAGGVLVNRVARWNGEQWVPLIGPFDIGMSGQVNALEVWDDGTGEALFAGGDFVYAGGVATHNVARWDGSQWSWLYSPYGIGVDAEVFALEAADDGRGEGLFVGGDFWVAGDTPANRVARWDGTEWSTLLGTQGIGADARVDTLKGFIDNGAPAVFVGGVFEIAGGVVSHSIARWSCVSPPLVFADGFEWSDLRMWSISNE